MLIKVASKDTAVVVAALSRHARNHRAPQHRSLTWHHELEIAKLKTFRVAAIEKVYFCEPRSPSPAKTEPTVACVAFSEVVALNFIVQTFAGLAEIMAARFASGFLDRGACLVRGSSRKERRLCSRHRPR